MLYDLNPEKILFLDIETVPQIYRYKDLDEKQRSLWESKNLYQLKDGVTAESVYEKAGIYAEFGRIVCISVGYVRKIPGSHELRLKSFSSSEEKQLLVEFRKLLDEYYNTDEHLLCAHNGKEFDFPYIARRMLVNGIKLPAILNIAGKKPWEVRHLDTMELWKFGDYKHYTSLNLLAQIFNIPTPKDDISGADVARVFWEDNDIKRIVTYCEKDVVALVQLLMRFRGEKLIQEENIHYILKPGIK